MDHSLKHSVSSRNYRLMTFVLVVGSLSVGVLLLRQLTDAMRQSIFWYYGVPVTDFRQMQELGSGGLSLTLGQVAVALIALCGAVAFVAGERRRLARLRAHRSACERSRYCQAIATLSWDERRDTFVLRTSLFSGVLLLLYVLQVSFERFMSGYGWGLEYAGWTSVLPLASILGLCVLVGLFVAAVSMFGLRIIYSLEVMLTELARQRHVRGAARAFRYWCEAAQVTLRDRFGDKLLSRPPPAACVVAA